MAHPFVNEQAQGLEFGGRRNSNGTPVSIAFHGQGTRVVEADPEASSHRVLFGLQSNVHTAVAKSLDETIRFQTHQRHRLATVALHFPRAIVPLQGWS